ncbi:MAG TPA: class I mannose-6-phosphate isomerase [Pseudonocardia sp.]|nr:class I mannose-6-phosphate isomerase [Pseudonocardia sp.]
MKPVQLSPNLIDHFYRGGARIAALRGLPAAGERQPEEWIAATVSRFGSGDTGLARTVGGELLRDLVAADPVGWVGARHAGRFTPEDTGLLVKLLDAGQRLPVHVHPDRGFARSHLGCPYGKTEAWLVLEADPGAAVHLGWTTDVDPDELATRRDAQDGDWMLERMHRIEVHRGDGILVPAGQVHAIGAGAFVLEAQEPTDFSILLEWSVTTETRDGSHLGLGFDTAMGAVSHRALGTEALRALATHVDLDGPGPASCLVEQADPFFRVDLLGPGAPVPAGFGALVVLDGGGALHGDGGSVEVAAGQALAVPAGFGAWTLTGDARGLLARPGRDWPGDLDPVEVAR